MNVTIRFEALVPGSGGGDDLDTLRSSIKADGLVRPLTVTPLGDGRFKVVKGNSRYYSILSLMQTGSSVWDGNMFRPASRVFESINCILRAEQQND